MSQPAKPQDVQPLATGEFKEGAAPPGAEVARAIADAVGRVGIHASGPQIQEALAGQGVNVDLPQILAVRNRMQQRSQTPAAPPGDPTPPEARGPDPQELLKVKGWAQEVGGVQRLKELCDLLLRLQG
jgi:hypothetical protein